jgi:hypothetical protein
MVPSRTPGTDEYISVTRRKDGAI